MEKRFVKGTKGKNKIANILGVAGLILVLIPAILLLNGKYQQWAQAREWKAHVELLSDDSLRTLRFGQDGQTDTSNEQSALDSDVNTQTAGDIPGWSEDLIARGKLKAGDSIAYLEIPRLDLKLGVIEGESWSNLAKGPTRVTKTAKIGDRGTVLISGHRTMYGAPFHNLHLVKLSDEIILYTKEAYFIYTVTGIKRVKPDDWSDIKSNIEPRLVLSTCEPIYSAEKRLLIIAQLQRVRALGTAE